ncbi:MAG: hypothetical protein A2277_08600 [Desulfobacterales bacterium RIFOXYA12_FULL_46_15]|nr:MAG: hypothetical protein A2277_08600 [Desulfobacterales bacterium RIFOXYA12_FULL_46_15]
MQDMLNRMPYRGSLKRTILFFIIPLACLILPVSSFGVSDPCPPFFLKTEKGEIINPMTGENADQPYSSRKTCGTCHDVDKISKGYHFMMDWDKASDDRFKNTQTPWLVSTGLTGGLITYGYFQMAKKKVSHPDEIDLTAFEFIARVPEASRGYQKPGCAGCHAGGGMMEFDRDGQRYDIRLAENPELAGTLDGDYYKSRWDKTGVIEPDCFLCHGNRYQMQTRIEQTKNLNFKWIGTAASGMGKVYGRVSEGGVPKVVYNKRLFNEDGTFYMPDMVFKPEAENCLLCHASIELGKRGNSWDDPANPDVHHLAGLTCIDCHPGDISHNFAKGNAMDGKVAGDLDNTMRSCRDCHTEGYKGATRMKHQGIRQDHLNKLSCEACHIPELKRSAVGAMFLNTGVFGKHGQADTKAFGDTKAWKPAYVIRKKDKDGIARITPVNPVLSTLFTNREETGVYVPLFLSEVEKAYEKCRDKMSDRKPAYDFHRPEDMILMLKTLTLTLTLTDNKRFSTVTPQFHTGGRIYSLSPAGTLVSEEDTTWVQGLPYYSISHNVSPAGRALGAGGCKDCHSKDSHLFNGLVVTDYFGANHRPVTVSMSQFLDLSLSVRKWNRVFEYYLKAEPFLFTAGIFILTAAVYIWQVKKML